MTNGRIITEKFKYHNLNKQIMSEVEEKDLEQKSLQQLFADSQETLEEAQARKSAEELTFTRFKNFIMDKAKTYRIRILPLSPKDERRGYEHPVRQKWLKINNPDTGKDINIKVCRAIDAGYSVDLIDTYKKLALDAVKGGKDLEDKIKNGSFGGGLKYDYNHAMYIYDLDNMEEGMMIWEASNGQWKGLEDQKDPVWKKLVEKNKNPKYPCPISSFDKGYPVEIQKKKGPKTEYVFSIDILGDSLPLDEKQLSDLVKAPLLTDIVKRYTKYHLGATIEFLKQYDETIGQNIMSNEEMVNAIEILKGELPADDTSSFSFKKGDNGNDEPDDAITYDKLSAMYDDLTGKGITDKSDEGQNLRSLIAEYIKSRNLSVKVERKKTNMTLLDEIEAELEALGEEPSAKTSQSTSVNSKEEKEDLQEEDNESNEEDCPNQDATAEPAVGRRKRK